MKVFWEVKTREAEEPFVIKVPRPLAGQDGTPLYGTKGNQLPPPRLDVLLPLKHVRDYVVEYGDPVRQFFA